MIRAYVTEDLLGMNVRVSVVQQPEGGSPQSILRLLVEDPSRFDRFRWEPIESTSIEVTPTLTIGREEARAVLDSLTRFFHGAEDTRALRADYDAERDRVDKLTDSLAGIAQALASVDA